MSEPEPELLLETKITTLIPMNLEPEPDDYSELDDESDESIEYEDADTSGDPVSDSDEEAK